MFTVYRLTPEYRADTEEQALAWIERNMPLDSQEKLQIIEDL